MARRKKNGLADVVVEATALLPWWAGVALALVSYFWLHSIAQKPLTMALQAGQAGSFVATTVWHTFATIGQYFLPFLFLLGAGVSSYKWQRAGRLHAEAANRADGVAQGTWREFEVLVGEYSAVRASPRWTTAVAGQTAGWTCCCKRVRTTTWFSASSGARCAWACNPCASCTG